MSQQANPYPLRLDTETMAKLKVIAKSNGRSVNKEIEIIAQRHIAAFEKESGPIQVKMP